MKKLCVLLICLLSLCLCCSALADSGSCGDNATWDLTDGVLTIKGTGAIKLANISFNNQHVYMTSVIIEEGVTAIGDDTFRGSADLKSVSIPASVTSIGKYAFYQCYQLESVTFAANSTLETIGENAFKDDTNLTSIKLPDSVTSLGSEAISTDYTKIYCANPSADLLKNTSYKPYIIVMDGSCGGTEANPVKYKLTAGGNLTISGSGSMKNYTSEAPAPWHDNPHVEWLYIEGSVNAVGDNAFRDCTNLTRIYINSNLESIGASAFRGCTNLPGIEFGGSLKSVGDNAFRDCTGLKSVTLPAGLETIGENAFSGLPVEATIKYGTCKRGMFAAYPDLSVTYADHQWNDETGFCSVCNISKENEQSAGGICGQNVKWVLEDGTLTISGTGEMTEYAKRYISPWYDKRDSITTVKIDSGVTSIGANAFAECKNLTDITIPEGVKSIGMSALSFCESLTTVTLPASLERIGESAFSHCENLESINLPTGITSIGNYAFTCCYKLKKITIPDKVKTIGEYTFFWCTSLTEITLPAGLESIDEKAFDQCTSLKKIYFIGGDAKVFANVPYTEGADLVISLYSCGADITCELTANGKLSICGTGAMKDYSSSADVPWYGAASNVKTVIVGDGVTAVGAEAFDGLTNLTAITLPASVKTVGANAFRGIASGATVTYGGCDRSLFAAYTDITVTYSNHTWNAETGACSVCSAPCPHTEWNAADGTCSTCGYAHPHASEDWTSGICKVCGYACTHAAHDQAAHCTVCDVTGISHTPVTDAAVPATCTTAGLTEGSHCSVCELVLTAQAEIPAPGHSYAAGVCTVCGMTESTDPATPPSETAPVPEAIPAMPVLQDMTLEAGESVTFACDAEVVWSSSSEKIVEIIDGTAVAKKKGTAVITATAADGRSVSCTITVEKSALGLTFTNEKGTKTENFAEMKVGTTATLAAKNGKSCKFTSSDKKIVSVDKKTGELKAKKPGVATITVKQGKKEASFTIEVKSVKISLNKKKVTLKKGETFQIVAEQKGVKDAKFTFKSDNKKIASVDKNTGLVTAKKKGTCTITVKSSYGQTATVMIKVKK